MYRSCLATAFFWLAISLAGCPESGEYRLHLVFVDAAAEALISEVGIWVLRPGGHQCLELTEGEIRPGDMSIQAELTASFPGQENLQLDQVPSGELLFFAEGRTADGGIVLRGCIPATVRGGTTVEVTLVLDWICHPDPAGEIPNNGVDDDCDGLTDDCEDDAICDDQELCTSDFCTNQECKHTNYPPSLYCDDGNLCTLDDHCQDGRCQGTPKDCSEYDGTCLVGVCDPGTGQCTAEPVEDGSECSDGRFCTIQDACTAGVCSGQNQTCDDSDPCTRDVCNDAIDECQHALEPVPGAEGTQVADSCQNGLDDDCDGLVDLQDPNCIDCTEDADCDDQNDCTEDSCHDNQCLNNMLEDGFACNDGDFCTTGDACEAGMCRGSPRDCSHLDGVCLKGICSLDQGACVAQPLEDGIACEDGLYCTIQDSCLGGVCLGVDRTCSDGDFCTRDECNEALDRCDHILEANPGAEGPPEDASCENYVDDDCDGLTDLEDGSCSGCADDTECDDENPCTDDICDVEGECQNPVLTDGTPCDDGLYCSDPDTCTDGVCAGPARDCNDDEPCTLDQCNEDTDECRNTWEEHSQQPDLCLDGLDQNCDGVADECCLGNGDFLQGGELSFASPVRVVTGDFNADRIPDILALSNGQSRLEVYLGGGTDGQPSGSFSFWTSLATASLPRTMALGDFNSDHILDLAVIAQGNSPDERLNIFLGSGSGGQGDGSFLPRSNFPVGELPFGIVVADLNSDGISDLAVADVLEDGVKILLGQGANGQGDGNFSEAVLYPSGDGPYSLAVGDVDSDRILDLVVANHDDCTFSVLLGQGGNGRGNGSFGTPQSFPINMGDDGPGDIAVGDFNSDHIVDVAISTNSAFAPRIGVYLGDGSDARWDGSFTQGYQHGVSGGDWSAVAVADLNGDGIQDLVSTNIESDRLNVYIGSGSGGQGSGYFGDWRQFTLGSGARAPLVADLDGDHILDVVVPRLEEDAVTILRGYGSGSRSAGAFLPRSDYALAGEGEALAVGDFNADHIPDLAVHAMGASQPLVQVFRGLGSDGRGIGVFWPNSQQVVGEIKDIETADLDLDGILDLLVLNDGAFDSVGVLMGNGSNGRGDGTFASMAEYPAGDDPFDMVTGDFNSDGIVDVASTNMLSNSVVILVGDLDTGGYRLQPQAEYDLGQDLYWMCAADLNSDRITDLAIAAPNYDVVKLLQGAGSNGQGDGTFLDPVDIASLDSPVAIACRDVNSDGLTDMVVSGYYAHEIAVHPGLGNGTFGDYAGYPLENRYMMTSQLADLDGDGILDLLLANAMNSEIFQMKGGGQNGRADGSFSLIGSYPTDSVQLYVSTGDFNSDGILDLAVPNSAADSVSILPGEAHCLSW